MNSDHLTAPSSEAVQRDYQRSVDYTEGMIYARQVFAAASTPEQHDEALLKVDALIRQRHDEQREYRQERRTPAIYDGVTTHPEFGGAAGVRAQVAGDPACTCGSDSPRAYNHAGMCPHSVPWNERVKSRLAATTGVKDEK